MDTPSERKANLLVLYHSASGNTKAMAELVADGTRSVAMTDVRLLSIAEATSADLEWCDGLAVGSPTNMGTIAWEMKRWWDVVAQPVWPGVEGKVACAFSSSGGLAGGGELTCQALLTVLMNFGFLVFGVPDYVAPGRTLHYGAVCAGKPRDEGDEEACRRLGVRLAEWTHVYACGRREFSPQNARYKRF